MTRSARIQRSARAAWAAVCVALSLALASAQAQPAAASALPVDAYTSADSDAAGRVLVTAARHAQVALWELPGGARRWQRTLPAQEGLAAVPLAVAVAPDGTRVAVAGRLGRHEPQRNDDGRARYSHELWILDARDGRTLARWPVPALPNALHWSRDGRRIVASASDLVDAAVGEELGRPMRAMTVFDAASGQPVPGQEHQGWFEAVAAFDPTGRLAVVGAPGGETVLKLLDPLLRQEDSRSLAMAPASLAWSPDGRRLLIGSAYGDLGLYAASDLVQLARPELRSADAPSDDEPSPVVVAWSDTGQAFFAGGASLCQKSRCVVRRFDVTHPSRQQDFPVDTHPVQQLVSLPGGRLVFVTARPSWGILQPDGRVDMHHRATHVAAPARAAAVHAPPSEGAGPRPAEPAPALVAALDAVHAVVQRAGEARELQRAWRQASQAWDDHAARLPRLHPLRARLADDAAHSGARLAMYRMVAQTSASDATQAVYALDRALLLARLRGDEAAVRQWAHLRSGLLAARGDVMRALDDWALAVGEPVPDTHPFRSLLSASRWLGERRAPRALEALRPVLATLAPTGAQQPSRTQDAAARAQALGLLAQWLAKAPASPAVRMQAHGQAVAAYAAVFGSADPRTLRVQVQFAHALAEGSRPAESAGQLQTVLEELGTALGDDDEALDNLHNQLARRLVDAGRPRVAMQRWSGRIAALRSDTSRPAVRRIADERRLLEGLGDAQLAAGEAAAAAATFERVLQLAEVGIVMPAAVRPRVEIQRGLALARAGETASALQVLESVVQRLRPRLTATGAHRVDLADAQVRRAAAALAQLERHAGRHAAAQAWWQLAAERDQHLATTTLFRSATREELQRLQEADALALVQRYLRDTLQHHRDDPSAVAQAYAAVLARKGRAEALARQDGGSTAGGSPALREAWRERGRQREALSSWWLGGGTHPAAASRLHDPANDQGLELLLRAEAAESEWAQQLRLAASLAPVALPDAAALSSALAAGEALIDIVRLDEPTDADVVVAALRPGSEGAAASGARYIAFVLRPQRPLRLIDLGAAATIDAEVTRLHSALRDPLPPVPASAALARLHSRLWAPLMPALDGAGRVVIAADSELHRVPFAALSDERGDPLISSVRVAYVARAQDVLKATTPGSRQAAAGAAIVLADPEPGPNPAATAGPANPTPLPRLPGARREAQAVATLLRTAMPVSIHAGPDATVSRLTGLQNPRVLHVATHGYVIDPVGTTAQPRAAVTSAGAASPLTLDASAYEPALAASGLVLAGATEGAPAARVSALELAQLRLAGTSLVVLSACDTGAGTLTRGQGVLGLRHALQIAGAEQVVVSLFPVRDEATAMLMQGFYERLPTMSVADALHEAQWQRHRELLASGHPDPVREWAGFIVQGIAPFAARVWP